MRLTVYCINNMHYQISISLIISIGVSVHPSP